MKWEYKIVRVLGGEWGDETLLDRLKINLDMYGAEGWEAVGPLDGGGVGTVLMKRQISN